jgi:hypothetical protein
MDEELEEGDIVDEEEEEVYEEGEIAEKEDSEADQTMPYQLMPYLGSKEDDFANDTIINPYNPV